MAELAALGAMIVEGLGTAATAVGSAASAAAPYAGLAGTAASVGGTVLAGQAAKSQGKMAQQAAEFEAKQAERAGAEERAAASREMLDQRRRTNYVISKQTANAAASGAGTSNPTILDIIGDTAQEGAYQAKTIQATGENRARGRLDQAAASRFGGKAAKAKGDAAWAGSLLEGFGEAGKGLYDFKKQRGYG